MLKEFKDFINRGNVIDLAVAVVLGVAFVAVVGAFVNYLLLPIVGLIFGDPDFGGLLNFTVNDVEVGLGDFVDEVINFLFIALGVFLVVKAVNRFRKTPEAGPTEIELLTQIRDSLQNR